MISFTAFLPKEKSPHIETDMEIGIALLKLINTLLGTLALMWKVKSITSLTLQTTTPQTTHLT